MTGVEDRVPRYVHGHRPRVSSRLQSVLPAGLAADTGWATGAEVATLASGLAVFYLVTTRLGPAGYGYFVGAQTLVAMLAMLSSAWVGMLLLQQLVRDRRPASEVFPACLFLTLLAGTCATLMALGIGTVLLPGLALGTLLLFALAELLGAGMTTLAAALLQASDDYRGAILLRICVLLLRLVAVAGLVVSDSVSLRSIAVSFFVVSVTVGALALALVSRRLGIPLRLGRPSRRDVRSGLSYAGTLVAFAVQEDADKLLLVRLADPVTAGLYAAAYRAVQLALVPIRALTAASHRRFLQHDPLSRGEHLSRSLRFTAAAGTYGLAATIVLLVGAPLVPRLLGPEYERSGPMVMLLAPLVLCRGLSLFGFNGLMGLRRNGVRVLIIGFAAALNAALNILLIRQISWQGAAVATLCAEVFLITATWFALLRYQRRHDSSLAQGADVHDASAVPEATGA